MAMLPCSTEHLLHKIHQVLSRIEGSVDKTDNEMWSASGNFFPWAYLLPASSLFPFRESSLFINWAVCLSFLFSAFPLIKLVYVKKVKMKTFLESRKK